MGFIRSRNQETFVIPKQSEIYVHNPEPSVITIIFIVQFILYIFFQYIYFMCVWNWQIRSKYIFDSQ